MLCGKGLVRTQNLGDSMPCALPTALEAQSLSSSPVPLRFRERIRQAALLLCVQVTVERPELKNKVSRIRSAIVVDLKDTNTPNENLRYIVNLEAYNKTIMTALCASLS